jgi:hypothetical protein
LAATRARIPRIEARGAVVIHRRSLYLALALAGTLLGVAAMPAGAAGVRFGNALKYSNGNVREPSIRQCDVTGPNEGDPCTMVSALPLDVARGIRAPKDGRIVKIRLVAAEAGSFRLMFAQAKPAAREARIVKRGPVVTFAGTGGIEVRSIDVTVRQGWYIAIQASTFRTLTCFSGSPAQLEFQPPPAVGGPYTEADNTNGCYLLVELQYAA